MKPADIIDCHAHVIDPARFAYADGPGYRPLPHAAIVEQLKTDIVADAGHADHDSPGVVSGSHG